MDIICLSETYLDSSIQSDNDNLKILGRNLVRSDRSSNNKRGGVCYKSYATNHHCLLESSISVFCRNA